MDARHEQPDSPEDSLRGTIYSKRIVEEGVENVGKRTPSDLVETGCHGKSPWDCRESVHERLSNYTAKYS